MTQSVITWAGKTSWPVAFIPFEILLFLLGVMNSEDVCLDLVKSPSLLAELVHRSRPSNSTGSLPPAAAWTPLLNAHNSYHPNHPCMVHIWHIPGNIPSIYPYIIPVRKTQVLGVFLQSHETWTARWRGESEELWSRRAWGDSRHSGHMIICIYIYILWYIYDIWYIYMIYLWYMIYL